MSINKSHFVFGLAIMILGLQYSCSQAPSVKPDFKNPLFKDRQIYMSSSDSSFVYWVDMTDSLAAVYSWRLSRDFNLPRVPTASGAKFQDEAGFYLWTKGNEFMWGKGDSVWTKGMVPTITTTDVEQVDKPTFSTTLIWNELWFTIQGKDDRLTITPHGLEINNQEVSHETYGTVLMAEIGDLNRDNYPEIMVYISAVGSGSYGSIIGYSVNNGKSMSQIYLPDLSSKPEISKGYMGHDEFAMVENTFVQRFPIYNPEDSNAEPTGGTRQVQYKLIDGEAARLLIVDKVIEY